MHVLFSFMGILLDDFSGVIEESSVKLQPVLNHLNCAKTNGEHKTQINELSVVLGTSL